MEDDIRNPFPVMGYISPEYFCDREKDTAKLKEALLNGRNVVLLSDRRIGKTGLIENAFHQLREEGIPCFLCDIYDTTCRADFAKNLAESVLGKLDTKAEKVQKGIMKFFGKLRPVMQMDGTGTSSVSLDYKEENAEETIDGVFNYLENCGTECCIAIDEFQQITLYPEKNIEATLRKRIQKLRKVHFVFAGSAVHTIEQMFSSASHPFYMSAQKMGLDVIPMAAYKKFAAKHFAEAGRKIQNGVFEQLYGEVEGVTWNVQYTLNHLFGRGGDVTPETLDKVFAETLLTEEDNYRRYCKFATANQLKLLKAIALEKVCKSPTSAAFIKKYDLPSASSILKALQWLLDYEFVIKKEEGYQIYEKFFGMWLRKKFGK